MTDPRSRSSEGTRGGEAGEPGSSLRSEASLRDRAGTFQRLHPAPPTSLPSRLLGSGVQS